MNPLYTNPILRLSNETRVPPAQPTHHADAWNRYCADRVTVSLEVRQGRVEAIGWTGEACAVCSASATLACDALRGTRVGQMEDVRGKLEAALDGEHEGPFGLLAPFGVLPSRRACAVLPWTALRKALSSASNSAVHAAPSPSAEGSPFAADRTSIDNPWSAGLAFRRRGLGVAIATLVDVVGSSPCPVGSHLVVASNGEFWGAVSGGCVESAVVQTALGVLAGDADAGVFPFRIANSQAGEIGLPCGGRVQIHVGPAPGDRQLRRYLRASPGSARRVSLSGGTEVLVPSDRPQPGRDRDTFVEPLQAPLRLVLVGGTRIAQVLSKLATAMGYEVIVIEPREGFAGPHRFQVPVRMTLPADALPEVLGSGTAVIALTHDERLDDPSLLLALPSDAFYVGALGSRKTQRARLERLRRAGVCAADLARLRGPVGLSIGAVGPEEIAVSILAEIVATRRQERVPTVGAVVLAAGSSRRAGPANKLLQPLDGQPLVRRVVRQVLAADLSGPTVVVVGHEADAVAAVLGDLPVQLVVNEGYANGMGTSIATGIEAIAAHGVDAAMVVLGDMPWLVPSSIRQLAEAHTPSTQHLIIVPVAGEGTERRRGNPVLWPARTFDDLRMLSGDTGGKAILARAPGSVLEVAVAGDGVLEDVDGILPGTRLATASR